MIRRKILTKLEKELFSDKIIVLTGMRRVGKTTLIRHLYDQMDKNKKLYLDLENPLNQNYFNSVDYDKIKIYLEKLAKGSGKNFFVFLDEIQNVRNLPSIVKYLYDHYGIKFILTGSASFYLKHLFSESLAGRKRVFELFPLDFEEFLQYKNPELKKPKLSEKILKPLFDLFDKYWLEYMTYGGFPSVVLKESHDEKLVELDDIFTSYFQKEIQLLSDFRKLDVVKSIMLLLISRVGSKIDVSKISVELGVSRITIMEYLDFLEGTYFLKRISQYSKKIDVRFRSQSKPYLCDSGFLTKIGNISPAAILENTVFNLLKQSGDLFYYQNKNGAEIDFVLIKEKNTTSFEVKSFAHSSDVTKLKKMSEKLGIKNYFLVSQSFSSVRKVVYPFQL